MSIDKLKAEKDVAITWRHYPLHPTIPKEGLKIKDRANRSANANREAYSEHLENQFRLQGIKFVRRDIISNSRMAQELAAWANSQEIDSKIHIKLFEAYFGDKKNLGDVPTLLEIAKSAGLDPQLAKQALENRAFADEVNRDWEFARENGITGVPTFHAKDLLLYGSQPYEVLERFYNNLRRKG